MLPGSVTLNPGVGVVNVTITVTVVAGYTASVTVTPIVNGTPLTASGSATAPSGSNTTSWTTGYYAGAAALPLTFEVTQAGGSQTTSCVSGSSPPCISPDEPVNYVEVTLTYELANPAACPTASVDGPMTYLAAGTSKTAECPFCAAGYTYSTAAPGSVAQPCQITQCAAGYEVGTGPNANANTCYSCGGSTAGIITTTSPWTCQPNVTCGGVGYQFGTASPNTNCYKCTTGTINLANNPPTCGYVCGAGTPGTGGSDPVSDCYTCPAPAAGWATSTVVTTTTPWTCTTTCPTGFTLDTANNTCYSCTTAYPATPGPVSNPPTDPTGNSAWVLDQQNAPWMCVSCPGAGSTPAGPALDTLITSTNPYECRGCPSATDTGPNAAGTTCTPPASGSACAAGYTLSGTTCKATSACNNTTQAAATAAADTAITPNATVSVPTGAGCGGTACTADCASASSTLASIGGTSGCKLTTGSGTPGTCSCITATYTAGSTTTPVCSSLGANYSATTATISGASATYSAGGSATYPAGTCTTSGPTCTMATSGCAQSGGVFCQENQVANTASCSATGSAQGDGYYGNDQIFSFTVPAASAYVPGNAPNRYYYHFALLREAAYTTPTTAGNALTGAAPTGTAGAPVPGTGAAVAEPFLYLKTAGGFAVSPATDKTYPFTITANQSAADASQSLYAGPNGPVLDCNKRYANPGFSVSGLIGSANPTAGSGNAPTYNSPYDYIVSEIDGYLPEETTATTYYLVIDNAAPTTEAQAAAVPAYQYFLQVGGFNDNPSVTTPPTYTQPSYQQAEQAVAAMGAKFVGVENSGLSCLQPGDNLADIPTDDFESRDFMEKLAYDLGSFDGTTDPPRPYVVPVRNDGTSCNPTCPATASGLFGSKGSVAGGTCAAWGAAVCGPVFTNLPEYDPNTKGCTVACTSNSQCPMNTPNCSGGICTTGSSCASGVSGLSCAVASAVQGLTSHLRENIYLRPVAVGATTYVPPGAVCTRTTPTSPVSPTCVGPLNAGGSCYGGPGTNESTCTSRCNTGDPVCASGICEPSTIPGDTNNYCIDPSVFIQSVQAVSTTTQVIGGNTVDGSQENCGIQTSITCGSASDCTPFGYPNCVMYGAMTPFCGIQDTGIDDVAPPPAWYEPATPPQNNDGMFNLCLLGSQVEFIVTFQMPFQRSAAAQQYEFDLGIFGTTSTTGAGGSLLARTRVILENPALSVANYYRYYDSSTACGSTNTTGNHVVWGNFAYQAICPSDGSGDFSQIRFCAKTSTTSLLGTEEPAAALDSAISSSGGGCAPDEVLLGIATASTNTATTSFAGGWVNTCPASGSPAMGYACAPTTPNTSTPAAAWTTCFAQTTSAGCAAAHPATAAGWAEGTCTWAVQNGFNVGTILLSDAVAHNAGLASDEFLRIRMEFDPSTPGDTVAPFLSNWSLDVDCLPTE